MKGDFSRGHNPDRKRGRTYRRVLAQEGRLILDSDLNALVDAQDHTMRRMSSDFGCSKGSPDLGFLITAGRLQALFTSLESVSVTGGDLDVYRDFSHKYLDRYPSLYLGNTSGAPGTATIELRTATDAGLALWVRSQGVVNFTAGGEAVNVNSTAFVPRPISPAVGTTAIDVVLDPGEEVWIGLIEDEEQAGQVPRLWSAGGSYYVGGLLVEQDGDGAHPDLFFAPHTAVPQDPAFAVTPFSPVGGQRLVAYLEAWERHLGAVEDRGVLEVALGGRDDTTTRTEAMGQVKLVAVDGGLTPEEIYDALCAPTLPDGTLQITTAQAANADPCALALEGGYTGGDNRLYRFEVHTGGGVVGAMIKWSRNNGSDLYRAIGATMNGGQIDELVFPQQTPLGDGDLVEVLNEWIDTTDEAPATLTAGGSFTPSARRVGRLVRLHSVPGASGKTFSMSEPQDDSIVVSLVGYGDPNANPDLPFPKVRVWHGLVEPDASPFVRELEDGITIEVDGNFQVGDYWQYEARARGANDNGPFQTSPHGPERLFAPLALLEYQSEATPLLLLEWLDERFPSLCSITADDVSFDGDRVGSDSDTVQEALEELFERDEGGGCCVHTLFPNGVDDAQQIVDLLNDNPGDVHICLKPGIYAFPSPVTVVERALILHGCPDALIDVRTGGGPAFHVDDGGRLVLNNLTLFAAAEAAVAALIEVDGAARGLEADSVGFLNARLEPDDPIIRLQGAEAPSVDLLRPADSLEPTDRGGPALQLEQCVVIGGWVLHAVRCRALEVRRSVCCCLGGGFSSRMIGHTDIVDTTVAPFNPETVSSWTAAEVEENWQELIEAILLPPWAPGRPRVALVAGALRGGEIVGCRLQAAVSVAARSASRVTLAENWHHASSVGIAFRSAGGVTIRDERIQMGDDGFVGVQIVENAENVDVESCTVDGDAAIGILLGAEIEESPQDFVFQEFQKVRVRGNRIEARQRGVQVGRVSEVFFFGVGRLEITGNEVTTEEVGILVRGGQLWANLPFKVRTADNNVSGTNGILVSGVGNEVESNRIRLTDRQHSEYGIFVESALFHTVVESNLVESIQDLAAEEVVAYRVEGGGFARLAGNVALTSGPIKALRVFDHRNLQLVDNNFRSGECFLAETGHLEAHGNLVDTLFISNSDDGSVRDNRVDSNLFISGVGASWQIEDNRVGGELRLTPRTTSEWIIRPNYATDWIYGFNRQPAWKIIDTLANERVLLARAAAEAPETKASRAARALSTNSPQRAANYAVANEGWANDWTKALFTDLDQNFGSSLFNPNFDFNNDLIWVATHEIAYQAQVVGNWSKVLQVGFSDQQTYPTRHASTIVQVVANHADDMLRVRSYKRSLVASNAADDFSSWISTQGTVNTDNMEF